MSNNRCGQLIPADTRETLCKGLLASVGVGTLIGGKAPSGDEDGCVFAAAGVVLLVEGERRSFAVGADLEVDGHFLLHTPLSALPVGSTRHIPAGTK